MKKFTKGLLALLLIVSVAVSAFALTGVFSSAQAIPENVSIDFKNADNDWLTLSGTTIKDSALNVTVYNFSEDTIVLSKIENNGVRITYDGWTQNTRLEASGITTIGISGTTNAEAVFTVTITYYVEGNPTATAETATAYIFASAKQGYTSVTCDCGIESGLFRKGVDTKETLSPVNSGSVTQTGEYTRFPEVTASVYIDGSKYKTWDEVNAKIAFYNGTIRDHSYFDKIKVSQSSNSGSFFVNGFGTDKDNKTFENTFDKDKKEGFSVQAGKQATVDMTITGTIPTEESSKITVELRGYGQTAGIFGVLSSDTKSIEPKWDITVYNNDKALLRDRLTALSAMGLNKASYKSGWDAYESALKEAYTVLGTMTKTASQVSAALTSLNNAYNNLVRYAVVYTNHYYYSGTDNTNPVKIADKIDMKVTNGASYNVDVLTNGTYPDYPFNRKAVVNSKTINVGTATNYTDSIDQYYWYVDTTALEAAIAKQAAKAHVDEDGNDIYSADSWQNYADTAAAAQVALNNQSLFQADIDAATKSLNDAEKALVKLDIDVEWLAEGIGWAGNIIDNSYDDDMGLGWDTEELFASTYAQELYANLVSAYNEAVEVTNDPDYTKAQADRVCVALWQAINDLRVKDEVTKGLYNVDGIRHADIDQYGYFQGLRDKLIDPNGLRVVYNDILDNTSGNYKLNQADFTEDSWYMLQDALYGDFAQGNWACAMTEEAYPTYDGEGELSVPAYSMINNIWFLASQAEYNACRDNLIDKVNNLEWIVDYSALEDKLADATAYNLDEYTQATAGALADKIADASAKLDKLAEPQLYGDPEAVTNDVVAETVNDLQAAINALQIKPKLTPSSEDVDFVEGEDSTIYGEAVGQTVAEVMNDVTIINDSESVVVKVYDTDNREMALNSKIGTGYKLVLSGVDGEIYETHKFVIKGDVSGDAQAEATDFALVYDYAFNEDSLEGLFLEAADLNGDGYVDLCDAVMLQQMYS
ncbi:MAG: dockerin type I repeat-containing protein [Clostridia bacterium]|nr:dockerin type I repeat-containing protein [Clostridia bacterium]